MFQSKNVKVIENESNTFCTDGGNLMTGAVWKTNKAVGF